jgi:cbb3-type cytochrome c oxidase subunit III
MRRMMMAVALGMLVAGDPVAGQSAGQKVFEGKGNCHVCHGKNAKGTPLGPDLTDAEWLNVDGTLAAITRVIRAGVAKPVKYPAPMPAMGGAKLSEAEISAVAAYVKALSGKEPVEEPTN